MTSLTPRMPGEPTVGRVRSMLAVAGVAVLLNGALALLGDESHGIDLQIASKFAPPGWLVGGVWVVLFALLGLARWRLVQSGSEDGRRCARWTIGFVVVCTLYPLYTLGLRSLAAGFVGNVGTALFAVVLGLRARRIDRLSAGVFALIFGWLCYATLAVAAQLGWLQVWMTRP